MAVDEGKIGKNLLKEITSFFSVGTQWKREEVVYVMTLFRKVLEITGQDKASQFLHLTFFIDWCLHCQLSRGRSLRFFERLNARLLQEFEEIDAIRATKGRGPLSESEKQGIWVRELCKIIRLNYLHDDLALFSQENSVELPALKNPAQWSKFNRTIVELLIETPLLFKIEHCLIRSMSIQENDPALSFGTSTPEAVFAIEFVDGSTADVSMLNVALEVPAHSSRHII